jgi:predicted Fe-Mo cluster-binding NifX family protein
MRNKVAIPILENVVAPCFEVARLFMVVEIESGNEIASSIKECRGCEGYGRVRFLFDHKIDTLICNGIKAFYKDLLITSGLKVISDITGEANQALKKSFTGVETKSQTVARNSRLSCKIPHEDLVCWSRELFEHNGFKVVMINDSSHILIDFVAEINCPLCDKLIKAAVCCGAHTYNYHQEIKEFYHTSSSEYQAKIYVFPGEKDVEASCLKYNIELIDPNSREPDRPDPAEKKIPLLKKPIPGHEKACLSLRH